MKKNNANSQSKHNFISKFWGWWGAWDIDFGKFWCYVVSKAFLIKVDISNAII